VNKFTLEIEMQAPVEKTILSVQECETALNSNGYLVADRNPAAKPGFPGKFMVYDPIDDDDGYCIVGDDRNSLIFEAFSHLEETFGPLVIVKRDDEIIKNDLLIMIEAIGSVKLESGSDQYLLLTRKDGEPLTPELAERWLLSRVYREGCYTGCYFCHVVNAVQKPFSETVCICVVEHRLDI
jgi:hypothetical protein